MNTAVQLHLNPQLAHLGIKKLATNPETKAMYKPSMDGKPAMAYVDDLCAGLVEETPAALVAVEQNLADRAPLWSLRNSSSRFVRGVTRTYEKYGGQKGETHYREFERTLPMLRDFAVGMRSAMKMRPCETDYDLVDKHLPRFVVQKLLLWEGSNTWYDNHCLHTIPVMMREWGSLRLVSQEGMESWQKKLNDILRLNNGWANAGAIPKWVHRLGTAAEEAYMSARAKDKPSSARWIYEQALLQQHAVWVETLKEKEALEGNAATEMDWGRFVVLWQRYLACATMRIWALARVRLRQARKAGSQYYSTLLKQVEEYTSQKTDAEQNNLLSDAERKKQVRTERRERYAADIGNRCQALDGRYPIALVARHPFLSDSGVADSGHGTWRVLTDMDE